MTIKVRFLPRYPFSIVGTAPVTVTKVGNASQISVPVFSTSEPGLAPTSPGGSSAFLRADGTWVNSGGVPGGASLTVQYNSAGAFGGMSGTSWDDTNRALTITGATVTTNKPILGLSQTWNAGGVAFQGIKLDVTNTASAAGARLLDVQVATSSKFSVDVSGSAFFASGAKLDFNAGDVTVTHAANNLTVAGGSLTTENHVIGSTNTLSWSTDVFLFRDGAAALSLRDGTNAQTYRVYNTESSSLTNYERLNIGWASNICTIETANAGTGTLRELNFQSSTFRWKISGANETLALTGGGYAAGTLFIPDVLNFGSNGDAGFSRIANSTVSITNGSGGKGYLQQGGDSRVAADFSKTSDTTLANVTGLSVTVGAGRTYTFEAILYTTSNVAGGVKFAIGGTATATSIVTEAIAFDAANTTEPVQTRAAALGTALISTTALTVAYVRITGTITVSAGGTLTVQFAQNASNGTASTVLRGSTFMVRDIA